MGELLPENPPFSDESSWEKQKGKTWRKEKVQEEEGGEDFPSQDPIPREVYSSKSSD